MAPSSGCAERRRHAERARDFAAELVWGGPGRCDKACRALSRMDSSTAASFGEKKEEESSNEVGMMEAVGECWWDGGGQLE